MPVQQMDQAKSVLSGGAAGVATVLAGVYPNKPKSLPNVPMNLPTHLPTHPSTHLLSYTLHYSLILSYTTPTIIRVILSIHSTHSR